MMNFTFEQPVPSGVDSAVLFSCIESGLKKAHFNTYHCADRIRFERRLYAKSHGRLQIIYELYNAISTGEICLYQKKELKLVCRISYFKHIAISIFLGLLIGMLFSWVQGMDILLVAKIAMPISLFFIVAGIRRSNTRMQQILEEVANNAVLQK